MTPGQTYPGAVVVAADGRTAIRLVDYEGIFPMPNRDARGVYFGIQLKPAASLSRLAVLFSGLSIGVDWQRYDLPEVPELDRRLVLFSEAAVGEDLDEKGLPSATPSGTEAYKVECFSYTLDAWHKRPRASDDAIFKYLEAKTFWSWKFEMPQAVFHHSDFLRFRATLEVFVRVATLGEALDWNRLPSQEHALILVPSPAFLRRQRDKESGSSSEALLSALGAPRYEGPRQHWTKALEYRRGPKRDLANAAKEAVSAVEGLARIITGDHTETLGALIKKMRASERLDGAMAKTLEGIWGFANNAPGVRHGGAIASTLGENEADFVLTTSEGALRFLLQLDR